MQDKKVYVAAAAFLTITTMVGTVMAGCGSGGSHIAGDSVSTRQLTWGGDIQATPVPTDSASPATRQLTWGGDIQATPAPTQTEEVKTRQLTWGGDIQSTPAPTDSASPTAAKQLTWGGD